MSKEQIDSNERAAFKQWLDSVYQYPIQRLNHFEHNLEVRATIQSVLISVQ